MADSSRPVCLASASPPSSDRKGRCALDARARLQLVDELREQAGVERLIVPPREWAESAGFDVALSHPGALEVDEAADPLTVFYVWHLDERERGIRIYCGLSRAFLCRAHGAHTWRDIWRFALELAVPIEAHRAGVARIVRSQPHCPVNVIKDVLAGRWS